MNKFILATAVAANILGFDSISYAGQGIPVLPARPLIAQARPGVIGENMPTFRGTPMPIVSNQFANNMVGEREPTFVSPAQNDNDKVQYAQRGSSQKSPNHQG